MSAYLIARVNIIDSNRYSLYLNAARPIIERFNGKALVRGGEVITSEGRKESRRIVVVEFPSMAQALEFYHSADYQRAKKLREQAAEGELIFAAGV